MKTKQKISILGCGWVGKALASHLKNTYSIMASVQSQNSFDRLEVENKTILNAQNSFESPSFYNTDTLIIAIPPRGAYIENLKTIFSHIQNHTQVILLSSTSVYTQPSLMLQAEKEVQVLYPSLLILRLGGLMGYNRIAGKYTAGKTLEHDSYVNYVHRDDVVQVITKCIEKNIRANVFNVVAPLKSTKKEIYAYNSERYGFERTYFQSPKVQGKKVSSTKLIETLEYKFSFESLEDICS